MPELTMEQSAHIAGQAPAVKAAASKRGTSEHPGARPFGDRAAAVHAGARQGHEAAVDAPVGADHHSFEHNITTY
jgi:hypothetical protein